MPAFTAQAVKEHTETIARHMLKRETRLSEIRHGLANLGIPTTFIERTQTLLVGNGIKFQCYIQCGTWYVKL